MRGFFLPSGAHIILMPGDRIVFTSKGNDLEIVDFYRGEEKLRLIHPYQRLASGDNEPSRRQSHVERIRMVNQLAAAIGAGIRVLERGERKTIFQFI